VQEFSPGKQTLACFKVSSTDLAIGFLYIKAGLTGFNLLADEQYAGLTGHIHEY